MMLSGVLRWCAFALLSTYKHVKKMKIKIDDLFHPDIHSLLTEHLQSMHELSPPESVHALDVDKLRQPEITFWSAWEGPVLLGCGALKDLGCKHGEIKSLRTPTAYRRRGAGRAILAHIIGEARERSYQLLSLETGSAEAFKPAHALYESFGFRYCGAFGDYSHDPNSVFMELQLKR
ncbi:MAG: GNAT family N-acetyltransferase [Burkholderiaceae bacterium]